MGPIYPRMPLPSEIVEVDDRHDCCGIEIGISDCLNPFFFLSFAFVFFD